MTTQTTIQRTELAHRTRNEMDVALVWVHGSEKDEMVVAVHDRMDGTSYEIPTHGHRPLDVYRHPFAYRPEMLS